MPAEKPPAPPPFFELWRVDNAVGATLCVGLVGVDAPQVGEALVECGAHGFGLARILVVDDHDAPRRCREFGHGVEQVGQKLLAFIGDDNDGELVDGSGEGGSHGEYILSRVAGERRTEAIECVVWTAPIVKGRCAMLARFE